MGGSPARVIQNIIKPKAPTPAPMAVALHQLQQKYLNQLQLAWMDMIQEKQKLKEDQ
jgi:hypothetical protein